MAFRPCPSSFPGSPEAPRNWLGLWGQSHPMSLGLASVGEIARSWVVSRRKPGEGPLGHAPTGWGGGDLQLWASFCPSELLLGRGKRERPNVGGGGRVSEATDFICATCMGIAALRPRPAAAWGPSCSGAGWGLGGGERQDYWGGRRNGSSSGLAGLGEPEMAALPGSEHYCNFLYHKKP